MKLKPMIKKLIPEIGQNITVEWVRLGDICKIETGRLNANAATDDCAYPFFTTAQEISRIDVYRWNAEALMPKHY